MKNRNSLLKQSMTLFIPFFLDFFICSCTDVKKTGALAVLKEWEKREIRFLNNHVFTVLGKDTVVFPLQSKYKILTYTDSTGCVSCKLQLTEWKKYMMEMDSISNNSVQFLFFFSPEKKVDILRVLQFSCFDYPVCIDEQNSLNKLNIFPSDMDFQTFLLDKNNKVIAIGNPIHNPKVKDLYLKIIQGDKKKEGSEREVLNTEVGISSPTISLGRFIGEREQKTTLALKNTGSNLLVIKDISTSCGCISVSYSKEPIRPGSSTSLDITYKADHIGHFEKTITVHCNIESSPIILKITGNAE